MFGKTSSMSSVVAPVDGFIDEFYGSSLVLLRKASLDRVPNFERGYIMMYGSVVFC